MKARTETDAGGRAPKGRPRVAPRDRVLRELAGGPRTLSELCRWALAGTEWSRVNRGGALVDGLVAEGLVVRTVEPSGIRMKLKTTYRLAPAKD